MPKLQGTADKVWKWIRNVIPYFIVDVITYPCSDIAIYTCWYQSLPMLVKGYNISTPKALVSKTLTDQVVQIRIYSLGVIFNNVSKTGPEFARDNGYMIHLNVMS